jgi:uncharacterized membrane protein YgdD (TMEM256/DUF423 family)
VSGREAADRWLRAFGALACACSVGLGAYASHAADGQAQLRLGLAALFAFGHGLALQALARPAGGDWLRIALAAMALGLCLFSGSLVAAVFAAAPTTLAPMGGLLLIAAWVMLAIAAFRD